jgi:hypothetical protein
MTVQFYGRKIRRLLDVVVKDLPVGPVASGQAELFIGGKRS